MLGWSGNISTNRKWLCDGSCLLLASAVCPSFRKAARVRGFDHRKATGPILLNGWARFARKSAHAKQIEMPCPKKFSDLPFDLVGPPPPRWNSDRIKRLFMAIGPTMTMHYNEVNDAPARIFKGKKLVGFLMPC
jgi:hypothetical protein